jgi:hypothetical protein
MNYYYFLLIIYSTHCRMTSGREYLVILKLVWNELKGFHQKQPMSFFF